MGPVNLLRLGCANDMLARLEMTTVHGGTSGRAMMQAQRCQQRVYRSDAFGLMGAHDRREDHARAMLHGVPASSVLGVLPNEPPHLIDCCGFHGLDRTTHRAWLPGLDGQRVDVLERRRWCFTRP
jgi:hypothetical protein